MANFVFTGSESPVPCELGRILVAEGHQVMIENSDSFEGADAVFCSGDCPDYAAVLARIVRDWPGLPVVVVTRLPETEKWLAALEAGAADYCAAPFERIQVRWIVSAVLAHRNRECEKPVPGRQEKAFAAGAGIPDR